MRKIGVMSRNLQSIKKLSFWLMIFNTYLKKKYSNMSIFTI